MERLELGQVLQQVRSRIAQHGGSRQLNEENTKAALVEPILRALGWDVEDLDEVQREYKRRPRDKPVDYALLVRRIPRLFIEVKALGHNLEDRRWANQIMGYASVAGVEWVLLTNGDEYQLYNTHATVPVEDKLFRTVRVTQDVPPARDTLDLLCQSRMGENRIQVFWNAHFVDRQIQVAIENLFSPDPNIGLIHLIRKQAPKLSPAEIRASLARARLHLDFPVETALYPQPSKPPRHRVETKQVKTQQTPSKQAGTVSLQRMIEAGVVRPPLDLEVDYLKRHLTAQIQSDGRVSCLGQVYDSLSAAAGMARASVLKKPSKYKYPPTNGWIFWRFRDTDGKLKEMDFLRQAYLRKAATGS